MSDGEPETIRCRALLNFRGMKFGKSYDLPDDERTWFYLGTGLLEEEWDEADDWVPPVVEVNDGPMLRGDSTPDT